MRSKIKDVIDKSNSIVLLTHENPDGDAIGSIIALYRVLTSMGKTVDMISNNFSNRFNFFKDIDKIVETSDKRYDLAIVLDCATKERIGQHENIFDNCKKTLSIDHHSRNTMFSSLNYIEGSTSSCTQVLFYLFKEWKINIDNETAIALMTGLLTDTNGFRNNNVDKNSYLMAAEVCDMGIDIYSLERSVLSTITMVQYNLMKIALDRLEFFLDRKVALTYITEDDMNKLGASYGDHEGIVEIPRNISGVEVSILVRKEDGCYISFRSNGKIDVANIAIRLGGNGHSMAAGAYIKNDFKKTRKKIINETIKEFNIK